MKSLIKPQGCGTKEVAQCCAKTSTIIVGCHD